MPPSLLMQKTCRGKANPVEYPYPLQVYPLRAWTSPLPGETRDTHTARSSQASVFSNQYTF